MSVTTPNMNLIQPTVGVDTGLTWENAQNTNATTIDLHNHTPGYGVQITPLGLNINSDLTFNGNNAIALRSSRYQVQSAVFSASADIGCVYVVGVDLYYRDINGNNVQITSGGTVNATSSGISSGSATASFVGGVLVVNAAANTPANVQAGSILLGNNSAGSKFLTLSPPNSMAANYQVFLPSIPSHLSVLTLDTSGNITTTMSSTSADPIAAAFSSTGTNSIIATMGTSGADAIAANMDSTGTNAIIATMGTSGANAIIANESRGINTNVTGGVGTVSASFTTTSGSYVTVATVSVVTSGRPVSVGLTGGTIEISSANACLLYILIKNTSTSTTICQAEINNVPGQSAYFTFGSIVSAMDFTAPAGTNTYIMQVAVTGTGVGGVGSGLTLYAYEI